MIMSIFGKNCSILKSKEVRRRREATECKYSYWPNFRNEIFESANSSNLKRKRRKKTAGERKSLKNGATLIWCLKKKWSRTETAETIQTSLCESYLRKKFRQTIWNFADIFSLFLYNSNFFYWIKTEISFLQLFLGTLKSYVLRIQIIIIFLFCWASRKS